MRGCARVQGRRRASMQSMCGSSPSQHSDALCCSNSIGMGPGLLGFQKRSSTQKLFEWASLAPSRR